MSEPKFTKGPWSAHGTHDADWVQTAWEGHDGPPLDTQETAVHICKCGRSNGFYDSLLISVAPEMYAMLETLQHDYEEGSVVHGQISTLLAKARGEL